MLESPRYHEIWRGNPAWVATGGQRLVDGGGFRPYIKHWHGRQAVYNLDYRARAGRVYLSDQERADCTLKPPFAIVSPLIKKGASPNKDWGRSNWEKVIEDFPVPVYQLFPAGEKPDAIKGAIPYVTPSPRNAIAAIERAAVVMSQEGGTHHMAASAGVPAVVIFGSFVPPEVTGYEFHHNIAVQTDEGYCGRWDSCNHCKEAMALIKPEEVREKALLILESYDAD